MLRVEFDGFRVTRGGRVQVSLLVKFMAAPYVVAGLDLVRRRLAARAGAHPSNLAPFDPGFGLLQQGRRDLRFGLRRDPQQGDGGRLAEEPLLRVQRCGSRPRVDGRGYDGAVDVGYPKHFRVSHGANEFADGGSGVDGIEGFWSFAGRRLRKLNGVPAETSHLHLKECVRRFDERRDNLYRWPLRLPREHPL